MPFQDATPAPILYAGGPLLPVHSPPQQRLVTLEKPLPSPPSAEQRDNANGIKQWWKRNRYRSKQNSSPGQAELGFGASLTLGTVAASKEEEGSEKTSGRGGYDMDVLTRQLAAVNFGSSRTSEVERRAVSHRASDSSTLAVPFLPARPTTTIGLQHHPVQSSYYSDSQAASHLSPSYLQTQTQSPFNASKRPPARYAPHVRSEDGGEGIHHSTSAPQLATYPYPHPVLQQSHSQTPITSTSGKTSAPHHVLPNHGSSYRSFTNTGHAYPSTGPVLGGYGAPAKTFEPDSRALQRFPDSPTPRIRDHRYHSSMAGQEHAHTYRSPMTRTATTAESGPSHHYPYREQGYSVRHENTLGPGQTLIYGDSHHTANDTHPPYAVATFKIPVTPTPSRCGLQHAPASTRTTWTPGSSTTSTPMDTAGVAGAGAGGGVAGTAVQCSGFTQKGKRCKKKVKSVAAYYALYPTPSASSTSYRTCPTAGINGHRGSPSLDVVESSSSSVSMVSAGMGLGTTAEDEEKRFCNVHMGQICSPEGFYVRNESVGVNLGRAAQWIQFDDYIPHDLEEQTKVLLRLTMESPLTSNESAGFIYAYELRDLGTDSVAYYKVGRTDNVPRRINEWKLQCTSHRPTLRDIFPQRDQTAMNASSRPSSSVLPGAMSNQEEQCMAVKRLEKLIHIELSARQVTLERLLANQAPSATLLRTGRPCPDCQTTHREIFAIPRDYQHPHSHRRGHNQHVQTATMGRESVEYEHVVRSVILRWQKFVDALTDRV